MTKRFSRNIFYLFLILFSFTQCGSAAGTFGLSKEKKQNDEQILLLGLLGISSQPPPVDEETTTQTGISNAIKSRGIWILGGLTTGNALVSQVDLFDPVTDTWYPAVTSIPTPRSYAGITSLNGKIYVMGGLNGTIISNLVEEYNPTENTWRTMATMPVASHGFVSAVIGNSIHIIYGATTTNTVANLTAATTAYRFDPNTSSIGTWTTLVITTLTTTGADRGGCSLNGLIYHGQGRSNTGVSATLHNAYPSTSAVETAIPTARHGLVAVCYKPVFTDAAYTSNSTISVQYIGGSTITASVANSQPPSTVTASALNSYYNPLASAVGTMAAGQPLLVSVYYPAAEVSYDTTKLYVFGGGSGTTSTPIPINTIQVLPMDLPSTNPWFTHSTTLPIARYGHKAVILNR